jgi:hypothetical protein
MTKVVVQEDENGELFIELSAKDLYQMGWTEETLLEWSLQDDGSLILRKSVDLNS